MKVSYLPQIKRFKIPPFLLLTIALGLIAIHLALNIRLKKSIDIPMSVVCWLAASSVLWDKRQKLKLGSSIFSSVFGILIIAGVLLISAINPDRIKFLGFFPFLSILGLAVLASGFRQLKQYRKELIILFTLGVPRVILPYLPDISPITAKFSTFLLWYSGFQVSLQDMHILIPNGGVKVVPACSGLNLILYMLGISVIFQVMFSHHRINKVIPSIVAVIIGFFVNGVRVSLLALLSSRNEHLFEYWHSKEGGLIFVVIAVVLFGWFYGWLMDWQPATGTNFKSSFNPFFYNQLFMTSIQTDKPNLNSHNTESDKPSYEVLGITWLQSLALIRFAGYGLLILALFDFIEILYPLNLLDSAWGLEMFGQLVERIPVPLIGFVLVAYGGKNTRYKQEKPILKALSWIALLIALFLFLLMPLSIINTVRIDHSNYVSMTSQKFDKMAEIKQIETMLDRVTTQAQMNTFLDYFEELPADIRESKTLDITKQKVVEFIDLGKKNVIEQVEKATSSQRRQLIKSSVKWNLSALISGCLFILIWQGTYWARKS